MSEPFAAPPNPPGGGVAIVYAGDYVNKLSGQRIERECLLRIEGGCRALVINFRDTELVNSIGVSILLGVIDAVEEMVRSALHVVLGALGIRRGAVAEFERESSALRVVATRGFGETFPPEVSSLLKIDSAHACAQSNGCNPDFTSEQNLSRFECEI